MNCYLQVYFKSAVPVCQVILPQAVTGWGCCIISTLQFEYIQFVSNKIEKQINVPKSLWHSRSIDQCGLTRTVQAFLKLSVRKYKRSAGVSLKQYKHSITATRRTSSHCTTSFTKAYISSVNIRSRLTHSLIQSTAEKA